MKADLRVPLSLRAYARRRGVSAEAVRKAIASGRLQGSVVLVRGQPKIADPDLADREWAERTRGPAAASVAISEDEDGISFNEARRRREVELWRHARVRRELDGLDLARRKGELIGVGEARASVTERLSVVKTKLLGLPVRVKQRLPHIVAEDVRVIDDLVREALEGLANGGDD